MMNTLILDQKTIVKLMDPRRAITAVEGAFKAYALGRTQMPAKIYLDLSHLNGDFRAMPSYIAGSEACAVKWVNVHPGNAKKNLPTVMATIVLSDPKTGFPLAVMDGTYLTAVRTAAAGAVAAKYLARKDSKVVALVGCGAQAPFQLQLLQTLFKIREVRVWGPIEMQRKALAKNISSKTVKALDVDSVQSCVSGADIIVTTTPSRIPLVKREWVSEGTHINAIGADAPGKEELDPGILKGAKVVIDDWAQASHSGEINVPISKGILGRKDIHAQIGDVIVGRKKGRTSAREMTVFDSTGLAIQDAAVALMVYKAAVKRNVGLKIRLF